MNYKKINLRIFFLFIIFLGIFGMVKTSNAALTRSGRWLYNNGSPVYLIGYDLQQLFAEVTYTEAEVKLKIDALASYGVTGFRVWVNNWFKLPTSSAQASNKAIFPYSYNSNTNKFDLNTWNVTYFTRYKNLLTYAKSKGMVVEVSIFSEYPLIDSAHNYWNNPVKSNYWLYTTDPNIAGNSNGSWANVAGTYNDLYPEFYTQTYDSGKLFAKQKSLASKVIDEFNPIGNVFFQVHNEWPPRWGSGGIGSQTCSGVNAACSPFCLSCTSSEVDSRYSWQQDMADYFHTTKGAITSVCAHSFAGRNLQGVQYWKDRSSVDALSFHPYITDSNPTSIPSTVTSFFSSLQGAGKILLSDEGTALDEIPDLVTQEMWAHFLNGAYYFAYQDNPFTVSSVNAGRITALSRISKLVNWPNMTYGQKALITKGPGAGWEVMAKTGEEYVAYFTGIKSTTAASLTLPSGTYNYKWYDTRTWNSTGIASGQVSSSGSSVSIAAPATTSWNSSTGVVLVIDKAVSAQSVQSLTIVNADTDLDIGQMTNGMTINLQTTGNNLSIRANTNPATVGSVKFGLDSNPSYKIESGAPYTIAGDDPVGNYSPWTPSVGTHTIVATPYSDSNGSGTAETSLTINFTVTNALANTAPAAPTGVRVI